jgi:hypothetical protein
MIAVLRSEESWEFRTEADEATKAKPGCPECVAMIVQIGGHLSKQFDVKGQALAQSCDVVCWAGLFRGALKRIQIATASYIGSLTPIAPHQTCRHQRTAVDEERSLERPHLRVCFGAHRGLGSGIAPTPKAPIESQRLFRMAVT